jgi:Cu+-exporting ATPase
MNEKESAAASGASELKLSIKGMSCVNCSNSIEAYLKGAEGVKDISVDFSTGSARVVFDESVIAGGRIIELISKLGFEASPEKDPVSGGKKSAAAETGGMFTDPRVASAVVFALPVFVLNMFFCQWRYAPPLMSVLTLPVLFYSGAGFHRKAFATFKNRLPLTMDALISASSLSSFFLSVFLYYFKGSHELYFDSSASIIAVILIGKHIEERMRRRSFGSLGGIIEGMPDECTVEKDGKHLQISVSEVKAGDTLVIKPNGRVPVDSIVISGEGFVENSVITGESSPVYISPGGSLWAGAQNSDAIFFARATASGRDSYINKIENMLDQALLKKAGIQKTADAIAAYFIPVIFFLAAATFAVRFFALGQNIEFSLLTAISVIAIACPCALGLALPTAFYFGANTAALHGIIFTDPDSLHAINKINAIAFDKTGTLTQSRLFVKNAVYAALPDLDEKGVLRLVASAERYSDHPAARALVEYAKGSAVEPDAVVSDYKTRGGLGITALCAGRKVAAGSAKLVEPGSLAGGGGVVFFASVDGAVAARFELGEVLNSGAAETVKRLKSNNIEVFLLTGDTEKNAMTAAAACGIDEANVRHSMKPDEKASFIERFKADDPGRRVAMVGDGVNDALSMASADIAIAMADATNIARTAANIILTGSGLESAVKAIELGRKMRRVIMQNFFWAFFYNAVLIPSAMAGKLDPMQAAFAMAASSIFVVLNSTRLKKI